MRAVVIAHKVLIASAVAFGVFLCARGIWRYRHVGDPGALWLGVLGGIAAVGLAFYFRGINRRYRKLLRRETRP